jgi:Tfp pilus assembly protein PilZ
MKPFERFRRRVTCDLIVDGARSHGAIVTDLSASGLFVRTKHTSRTGDRVRIVLHEDEGELEIDARVVREHRQSRHHTTGPPSGIGVSITAAPEAYFHLLSRLMSETGSATAPV